MAIKLFLLLTFFAVMVVVGFYCRKHATSVNGFILGDRSVGPWLTAFAYGTTYFSAVIFVGYAGQFGWKYGLSATWIGLGNAILGSLLAWVVLGRRTRFMTHHFDSATMPEFFGRRYDSQTLKLGASAIIFIFLIPYTASLYNGLSRLFGMAFGIDYTFCIIIMAVLTGIYVIAGGYIATAVNDFIQGIIMLGGIVAVIVAVLKTGGGFMASVATLAKVTEDAAASQPGVFASFFGPDPLNLLGVIILTSMGTWGLPQLTQKFYAIKSEKDIDKGAIISTLFATVIAGGCYFLGGFGRVFYQNPNVGSAPSYDAIIPSMLSTLSPLLIGIVVILVLSASMSTLSALVMASASTLTLDFIRGTVSKNMDEKKQLLTIRILIVVFIVLSVILAIMQYKIGFAFIAQLMGISWGALAGSFLAPFLYGLYWKKATKAACWVNFAFASGLMILNMLFRSHFPALLQSPINAGAFAMVAGLLIVPLVSAFTKAPDREMVTAAFDSYDRRVTVSAKQALEK